MHKRSSIGLIRLAGSLLAAAFLFLASGSSADAQAQRYIVKIYKGTDKTLCVGQSTTFTVAYYLDKGQRENTPPSLSFEATNGTITSANPTAGGASPNFVYFDFKAKQKGVAQLFATANGGDGSGFTTIRINECKYRYTLTITTNTTSSSDGVILVWRDVLKAEGEFTPATDGIPLAPLSPNGTIQKTFAAIVQEAPQEEGDECNIPGTSWSGNSGTGTSSVTGQLIDKGNQTYVQFNMDRVDVSHAPSYMIPCKKQPISNTIPLSFSADSLINEEFPAEGGTRNLQLAPLEKGMSNVNSSGDTNTSYTAVLTVTRVK